MFDIVTGGAGFIGSHLVDRLLAQGRKVRVLDIKTHHPNLSQHDENENFQYHAINVGVDVDYLDDLFDGVDRVFHLAALADIVPSIKNPQAYYRTNCTGTMNVLEAARDAGAKRFIYAASSSCYGNINYNPASEVAECRPVYPYALTKYIGEQLVMHWASVYQMSVASLRLFNVYGLRSRTNGAYGAMFGTFLAQKINGKPLTIVGDGSQQRDFVHVYDVVDAFLMAAASEYTGVLNVGTGSPESIHYIAKLIGGEAVHIPKRPGEPDITCASIKKIKKELGWEPKISIEQGIKEMIDNIEHWKDAPVWTPETIAVATKEWFERLGHEHV